jgi:hypothetical protein
LADRIVLAAAHHSYQVTSDCDLVSGAPRKPLLCQGIDPPIKRSANLGAKAGARKLGTFSGDQPPVEPGCPVRGHLLVEVKI